MAEHIDEYGRFQSDKYPTVPPDLVPLKVTDPDARDLLAAYAVRRQGIDAAFCEDLLVRLGQTRPKAGREKRCTGCSEDGDPTGCGVHDPTDGWCR